MWGYSYLYPTVLIALDPLKQSVADKLWARYQHLQSHPNDVPLCFIGFDGFTDEIVSAVQTRINSKQYTPFSTIAKFGQRIKDAAGKSGNIELVVNQKKLGGNAPIMTEALLKGGHAIIFAGTIGTLDQIEPLFQEMAEKCRTVIPLGPSAHSDAIEFTDGKIILGKLSSLDHINYDTLIEQVGKEQLIAWLDEADLLACANWTMLPAMTELWKRLVEEIIPSFHDKERMLFVDLADPAKRTDEDLFEAMRVLATLQPAYNVVLGLNEAEAQRLMAVLKGSVKGSGIDRVREMAHDIREKVGCREVVVHATAYAAVANGGGVWSVDGPYCDKPFLTTGAGDNFNAGYCNGRLYGFSPEEALVSGVATSGYYVRQGTSPTMADLVAFLVQWNANPFDKGV